MLKIALKDVGPVPSGSDHRENLIKTNRRRTQLKMGGYLVGVTGQVRQEKRWGFLLKMQQRSSFSIFIEKESWDGAVGKDVGLVCAMAMTQL